MIRQDLHMSTLEVGKEKNKVIYFDNFLTDPSGMVEYAASAKFQPAPGYDQRKGYPGVRALLFESYGKELVDRLAAVVASAYGIAGSFDVLRAKETLCLMTVPENELGPFQTVPHFDTSRENFFAVLLYLCGEEHGGTAFYRHLSTGYESISPARSDAYLDKCHIEFNSRNLKKQYFSESDEYYEKIGFIPAKFNRLAIYPGCLLHSANILTEISISPDPRAGRLTANAFFNFV